MFDVVKAYRRGKKVFRELNYSPDSAFIVLSSNEDDVIRCGIAQAEPYMRELGLTRITFIVADKLYSHLANVVDNHQMQAIIPCSEEDLEHLGKYLAIRASFWGRLNLDNFRIISLDYPYGKTMRLLYESNLYKTSSLVWKALYHYPNMKTRGVDGLDEPKIKAPLH